MRALLRLCAFVCALSISAMASAQMTDAMETARARSGNDRLLRDYAWTTMIQLFNSNTLAKQVILQQNYLPNGRLNKVVVSKAHSTLPEGFVSDAQTDYLTDLRDQLDTYRPTAGALLNFLTAAKMTGPDESGAIVATGKNVVTNGDSVTVWLDARTKQLRRIQVGTIFRDDAIQASATYATLPNGPTYMQYIQVDIPSKKVRVLVHSYDYVKTVSN